MTCFIITGDPFGSAELTETLLAANKGFAYRDCITDVQRFYQSLMPNEAPPVTNREFLPAVSYETLRIWSAVGMGPRFARTLALAEEASRASSNSVVLSRLSCSDMMRAAAYEISDALKKYVVVTVVGSEFTHAVRNVVLLANRYLLIEDSASAEIPFSIAKQRFATMLVADFIKKGQNDDD